jgi:small-conductance mechanosensitive channel
MNIFKIEISEFALSTFIIVGVSLFILLRIIKYVIPLLVSRGNQRKFLQKYITLSELIIWVLFFAWSIQYFLTKNQLYAVLLFFVTLILILLISWFALRDFVAGVIFNTNKNVKKSDTVTIKGYTGKIVRQSNRSIELETETGEQVIIPYSLAVSGIIVKKHPSETIKSHTFQLITPKAPSLKELISEIKTAILQLPWVSLKREPQIKPIDQQTGTYTFEVTIYSLQQEYFYKIEDYLKTHFEK